jgi:hypothetical protein
MDFNFVPSRSALQSHPFGMILGSSDSPHIELSSFVELTPIPRAISWENANARAKMPKIPKIEVPPFSQAKVPFISARCARAIARWIALEICQDPLPTPKALQNFFGPPELDKTKKCPWPKSTFLAIAARPLRDPKPL